LCAAQPGSSLYQPRRRCRGSIDATDPFTGVAFVRIALNATVSSDPARWYNSALAGLDLVFQALRLPSPGFGAGLTNVVDLGLGCSRRA
jgi:hypothetical protein